MISHCILCIYLNYDMFYHLYNTIIRNEVMKLTRGRGSINYLGENKVVIAIALESDF